MYYLNLFLFGSIIGFFMETSMKTLVFHTMNNGILFGPWIPIYGIGTCIIVLISKIIFSKFKLNSFLKIILFYFINVIVITIVEFVGGVGIEILFNKVFWDYSSMKFNLGHYICLEVSLLWGILSLIFIYFIKPIEDLIIKKIPSWLTILVLCLFISDYILTFLLT